MSLIHLLFMVTLGLFLNACGEESTSSSDSSTQTIKIEAGEDQRTKVNDTITISAPTIPNDENVFSYLWSYKGATLATTRSFTYIPTNIGIHILDFSILYNDGSQSSDSMNVIVTTSDINITIPILSEALKQDYLDAINTARTTAQNCESKGNFAATTTLIWSDKLYKASYEHTQDLIVSKTFRHEGSGSESDWTGYFLGKPSTLIERSEAYKYVWSNLGENLAGGTVLNTAQKVIQSWLDSDTHCENLMNPNFKEVGMVMLKKEGSLYTYYWSQNFGTSK